VESLNSALAGRLPAKTALRRAMAGRRQEKESAIRAKAASIQSPESPNINWRQRFIPWRRKVIPKPRPLIPASSEGFCEDLIFTLYKRLGLFIRK
jgi:hypothetical protein